MPYNLFLNSTYLANQMGGLRIHCNSTLVSKNEHTKRVFTKNSNILTPILAASQASIFISTPILVLSLPSIYIDVDLQKATKLALE